MPTLSGNAEQSFTGDTGEWVSFMINHDMSHSTCKAFLFWLMNRIDLEYFYEYFDREYEQAFFRTRQWCAGCGNEFEIGQEMYQIEGDTGDWCKECAEEYEGAVA